MAQPGSRRRMVVGSGSGYGSSGYGGREGGMGGRERWGERSGSDWEQSGWRDMDRGEHGRHHGGRRHEMSQRDMGGSMGGSWADHGGATAGRIATTPAPCAPGEYGSMGGERSSGYGGSRYGTGSYGGRSGHGLRRRVLRLAVAPSLGRARIRPVFGHDLRTATTATARAGAGMRQGRASRATAMAVRTIGAAQRGYGDERGFWDKASDEVSSWFGDEEAERAARNGPAAQRPGSAQLRPLGFAHQRGCLRPADGEPDGGRLRHRGRGVRA